LKLHLPCFPIVKRSAYSIGVKEPDAAIGGNKRARLAINKPSGRFKFSIIEVHECSLVGFKVVIKKP
jgi:hypothetical protein